MRQRLVLLARGPALFDVLLARGPALFDVLLARGPARFDPLKRWICRLYGLVPSVLLVLLLSWPGNLAAQQREPGAIDLSIKVHGFLSQGFIKSIGNNYLARSRKGSFEFTEVGLNATAEPINRLRLGIQMFARNVGSVGSYSAQFDWFYLDYQLFDWLGLRAGRTKLPYGLYNETNDVDMGRTPVLLPQSLYPIQNRSFLLAQNGGEVYGVVPLSVLGDAEYRIYAGTLSYNPSYEGNSDTIRKVSTPYLAGGRLMWRTPVDGLQVGASAQWLELDLDYVVPATTAAALMQRGVSLPANFAGTINVKLPATLWVASLEYLRGNWQLAAEYGRWYVRPKAEIAGLFPYSRTVSERAYALISYRALTWLSASVYHSVLFDTVARRKSFDHYQHDLAATLRFDVNDYWLIKLEGHYMRGTASLSTALNGDKPRSALDRDWAVFFIKTTGYF